MKKAKRWYCDACKTEHDSTIAQHVTPDGLRYCDEWEPFTTEMAEAEIEAYLIALSG